MARFDGAREAGVPLSIHDTICAPSPNRPAGWVPPAHGRLFAPMNHLFNELGVTEEHLYGCFPSDTTAQVERLVFEARTANVLDLGALRTGLRFEFIVGCKPWPLLPSFLDKIGQDGVARYDYFCDPMHVDEDLKMLIAEAEKKAQTGSKEEQAAARDFLDSKYGKARSGNPVHIPARQGFYVCWHANEAAHKVLCNPETIARVYLVGTLTRDCQ